MLGKKISASSKGRSNFPSTSAQASRTTVNKSASPGSPGPLVIPYIKATDNFKLLPRYSAALSRPHDDTLAAEDLDTIQLELELLLSTVAQRYRSLKSEYESLDKDDGKRERKGKYVEKQPASPGKRTFKRTADDKKIKESQKNFGHMKLPKFKSSSHSPVPSQHTDDSMDAVPYFQQTNHTSSSSQRDNTKMILPKNDVPNKFWLSVEPYCMPITQEDIKLLDDLMAEYSGPIVPPIPELGPHYSTQWATEDIKDEQDNSNPNAKLNKRYTSLNSLDASNMLKKGEKLIGDGITGPLTQRLVSALLEENISPENSTITSNHSIDFGSGGGGGSNNDLTENRTISMMKNGINIERRVKKELIEHGLLDLDDFPKDNEDEILAEIKRVRTELSAIAEYNFSELKKLQSVAKEEMKRLEVKRKLDIVDQKIIEKYNKVTLIKQKGRALTEQERDEVFRLTDEQKRLTELLAAMPVAGPNFAD